MATIKDLLASVQAFTITLASLASSAVGVGRQSTLIDNTSNLYKKALISLKITVGTTPTINTLIYVYLIRSNNDGTPIIDDGGGASDAGITIINAMLLGTILVNATTSNVAYYLEVDTEFLGSLGPKWGIAVVNATGVALHATGGNHVCSYIGVNQSVA